MSLQPNGLAAVNEQAVQPSVIHLNQWVGTSSRPVSVKVQEQQLSNTNLSHIAPRTELSVGKFS